MANLHFEQLLKNTQTRTLTTSVEAIVGSAGDDTITAPNTVAATGADQTTIQTGDTVDGGLGNDTLTMTFGGLFNTKNSLSIKGVENLVYVGVDNLASGADAVATATTAAAAKATALAVAAGQVTAAATNETAAIKAATAANTASYTAAAKQAGLTALDTAIAAEADDANLETDIAALTANAGVFMSVSQKATVDAAVGITDTNTQVDILRGAATGGKLEGLNVLKAAIAALTTTGATLEADIAALTKSAATTLLSTTEKAVVDAATGLAGTKTALAPYITSATTAATTALAAKTLADAQSTAATALKADAAITAALSTAATADATAKATLAAATAALGTVTIAANAEATSITIDGTKTTVSGLTDAQTVTMSGAIANTASTAATATKVNVKLSSASGTLTFVGGTDTATASVTGSLKTGTATSTTGSTPGTISLVDQVAGTPTSDSIKTLSLGLTSASSLTITELTALTTIDGSASTGALTLSPLASTLNVTTGSGADIVTFIAATDATNAKKLTSSLSTGAGNDTIVSTVTGTGTSAINAGAGDDKITLSSLGSATVDGGDGKDTIVLTNTTFGTGTYNNLKSTVTNVEVLSLSEANAVVDASKASQFTEYTLAGGGTSAITKVADTQAVNVSAAAAVSAAGYIPNGGLDANDEAVTKTAYAGTLAVKASGSTALTASATALNLTIAPVASVLNGVTTSTASAVTLTGDVKTATITLNNGVNNSKTATSDIATSVTIAPDSTAVAGVLTKLGNLTAVTLSGTGSATVTNSGTASKLATIDASGLAGKVTIVGSTLGAATAGLAWTAGTVSETVKLGSALDTMTIAKANSTYAKMDSITGFTLAADATGVLKTSTSDDITVTATVGGAAVVGFAKAANGYSTTSLDAALATLANRTGAENLVFQTNGNTYIFVDATSAANGVQDDDTVIELVGLVDLDNLVLALNA